MKILKINLLIALLACISIINNAQSVKPVKNTNGSYSFTFANVYFEVNPKLGGRVSSLKVDSTQILNLVNLNNANGSDNAGSVFWPSPQSVWNWPPPTELNFNAYSALASDSNLIVTSGVNSQTALRVSKVYAVNAADTSIIITYYLRNYQTKGQSWAPWEITRVNASGLTFFSIGSGSITGGMASNTKVALHTGWYCQDSTTSSQFSSPKFFCDGNGWLAHKTKERYLLIKAFPNIGAANAASGEAEVECYTSPDHVYTELEDQGAYTSIAYGDSLEWRVKWFVRKLPTSILGVTGEQKLLDYVNAIISKDTVTGIRNLTQELFDIYPNPVVDKLMIDCKESYIGNATASVYNLQGELILKQSLGLNPTIDMKNINSGAYIIQITGIGNERLLSKIIIKR